MIVLGESRYRVFGSPTFAGNPVTLFEVDRLDDDDALLRTAKRSSTVDNVLYRLGDGEPISARFFSSTGELWLCGHGLLALSHHVHVPGSIRTRKVLAPSGAWRICSDAQGAGVLMPAQPATAITDPAHWMQQSLRSIGMRHDSLYACPNGVWIAILRGMDELLCLDAEAIAKLPCGDSTPGALIAALSIDNQPIENQPVENQRVENQRVENQRMQARSYGFRYFAPWHGKPEDSGTGSAHCYLAPLMAASRDPVTALQFSPEGVAEMRVCLRDAVVAMSGRVELST